MLRRQQLSFHEEKVCENLVYSFSFFTMKNVMTMHQTKTNPMVIQLANSLVLIYAAVFLC